MNARRVALVLAIAAAAVIGLLRLAGTDDAPAPSAAMTSAPLPTGGTATAVETPSADAAISSPARVTPPVAATISPDDIDDDSTHDLDTAAAAAATSRFARSWTRHTGADATSWAPRLAALSTPVLAGKLRHADPAGVPADKVTRTPQITAIPGGADARITTDAGTLHLTLLYQGRWLVHTLDWIPAR
ncbi:hypothetical protein EV385_6747 [Krasilnikovia cinnamomea]|uniref:Uncharacterized protein n=1 Tax=Krasilnikovia cinnamomea TaxID=349313 RepID=A0A4Q7Z869_9ACTN|nr:hypothetical protein [Krasilnikovia cinnamomea]RZU46670.1 hypothetical protein EV385_6747 [Krasilnikovia cinnamomea]